MNSADGSVKMTGTGAVARRQNDGKARVAILAEGGLNAAT